ncbi:MAG: hypothetical protein NXI01_03575 [Gammaproteobacteria bacterium]|nr:hypothetical protein [Gammaproteobacteria bacterium]
MNFHKSITLLKNIHCYTSQKIKYIRKGTLSIPTKLWYANTISYKNNFGPRREIARFQKKFSSAERALLGNTHKPHAALLQKNGFYIPQSNHSKTLLLKIKSKVQQYMETEQHSVMNSTNASRFLRDPLDKIPEIKQFLSEDILRIIASYYGCACKIDRLQIWRNYHVPEADQKETEKFSNFFHHDNFPVTGLRVFVILSDKVTRETGAFRFHDKNTSRQMIRRLRYFHRYLLSKKMQQRLHDPKTLQFFEGNCGDICIVNPQECLHSATVPKLGTHRDMLQFVIYPSQDPLRLGQDIFDNVPHSCQELLL